MAEYPQNCGIGENMKVDGQTGLGTDSQNGVQLTVNAPDTVDIADFQNAGTTVAVIKGNGKVGIGTDAPIKQLDVNGDIALGTSKFLYGKKSDGTAGRIAGIGGDNIAYFGGIDSDLTEVRFRTGGSDRVEINSAGNVGIGRTSPQEKLDVHGKVRADNYIEYSKTFVGNALEKIKEIKSEKGQEGDWQDVDHDSLPEGVRYEKKLENGEVFIGRNLGNSVQLNLRAIQQLIDIIENQQKKIEELQQRVLEPAMA